MAGDFQDWNNDSPVSNSNDVAELLKEYERRMKRRRQFLSVIAILFFVFIVWWGFGGYELIKTAIDHVKEFMLHMGEASLWKTLPEITRVMNQDYHLHVQSLDVMRYLRELCNGGVYTLASRIRVSDVSGPRLHEYCLHVKSVDSKIGGPSA